jgi:hypothetical protein
MLAQLSERLELIQVFDDLFDRDGCTIELGFHSATRGESPAAIEL